MLHLRGELAFNRKRRGRFEFNARYIDKRVNFGVCRAYYLNPFIVSLPVRKSIGSSGVGRERPVHADIAARNLLRPAVVSSESKYARHLCQRQRIIGGKAIPVRRNPACKRALVHFNLDNFGLCEKHCNRPARRGGVVSRYLNGNSRLLGRGNLQTRGNTLARGRSRRYVLLAREYKRPSAVCKGRYNVEFTVNGLGRRALHEHVRIPVLVSAVRTELILRLYLQLHAGKPRPLYAHGYLVALTAVRRGNHYARGRLVVNIFHFHRVKVGRKLALPNRHGKELMYRVRCIVVRYLRNAAFQRGFKSAE